MQNIVIFGATGKTGRLCVQEAIHQGYSVTAFGRSVQTTDLPEGVQRFQGDILQRKDVVQATQGQDAVLVCLGPTKLKDQSTLSMGCQNIVDAMNGLGVEKVVLLSAAGVQSSWKQIPWTSKLLFRTLLKTVLAEHAAAEALFRRTSLRWTAVRAGVLTQDTVDRGVVASNTATIRSVSRQTVAKYMVQLLSDETYEGGAISITHGSAGDSSTTPDLENHDVSHSAT